LLLAGLKYLAFILVILDFLLFSFFLVRKFQTFTFLSVTFVPANKNIQDSFSVCYMKTPDRPDISNTKLIPCTVICICKHTYTYAYNTTLTVQWWNEEVRRKWDGEAFLKHQRRSLCCKHLQRECGKHFSLTPFMSCPDTERKERHFVHVPSLLIKALGKQFAL